MSIDWNDRSKRKVFRQMLQRVYRNYDDLDLFVDEELDENLAAIAHDQNVETAVHALLKQMRSDNRLNEVFDAFCRENPNASGIEELQMSPMVLAKAPDIEDKRWDNLFDNFQTDDLLDLERAFKVAVQSALLDEFKGKQLFDIEVDSIATIRERLEHWDEPRLAVLFASQSIEEIARSNRRGNRNLAELEKWRDRMAQDYGVSLVSPEVASTQAGYLIVSLKDTGQVTKGEKEVMLFPELRVDDDSSESQLLLAPMDKVKCKLSEVGRHLAELLHRAEDSLVPVHCDEVTLELFLAWPQIEEQTAQWNAVDRRGTSEKFKHRRYVVRSLDRHDAFERQPAFRSKLKKNWALLHTCIRDKDPYRHFPLETCFAESGQLRTRLSQKTGLKFIGMLPIAESDRKAMFYNIIDAAVPVALWIENTERPSADISAEIDAIFQSACLTCFDTVAECLMQGRANTSNHTAHRLKVLVDCPDRWPKSLPKVIANGASQAQVFEDEDLIVSL